MSDPFNLQRFVAAQDAVYETVKAELQAGEKRSHWMWFIFPQLRGLGNSTMAQRYSLSSVDEAKAYLTHPVLGERLHECSHIVAGLQGRSVDEIFGYPDDMKFRSSMTLFAQAATNDAVFLECLDKYFDGKPDQATLAKL